MNNPPTTARQTARRTLMVAIGVAFALAAPVASANIAFRAASADATGASTTLAITPDINTQQYDVMLAQVSLQGACADITGVPSGWTLADCVDGTGLAMAAYTKTAGATETSAYTWTFGGARNSTGAIVSYAGVDGTNPVLTTSTASGSAMTSVVAAAANYTKTDTRLVGLFATQTSATFLAPAGMSERTEVTSAGISQESADVFVATQAGLTGTKTATASASAANVAMLVVLQEPVLTLDSSSSTNSEGTTGITIEVDASGTSSQVMSIPYTLGGTASSADHNLVAGTLSIPVGSTSNTVSLDLADDALYEFTETLTVTFASPTNANVAAPLVFTQTITDTDYAPVSVTALDASAAEPANNGTFRFTRADGHDTGSSLEVDYTVTGTATSGTDFTALPGEITFGVGNLTVDLNLAVLDDNVDEPSETVNVTVSGYTNYVTGSPASAVISIADNENTSTVSIANVQRAEGSSFIFNATMAPVSSGTVVVHWVRSHGTTANADFTGASSGNLTFAPGDSLKTICINTVDDSGDEQDETFTVTLSVLSGTAVIGTGSATGTIVDNDAAPTVAFTTDAASGSEATTSANLGLTLSTTAFRAVSVPYTVTGGTASGSGVDYTLASGTATIAAGQTTANIALTVVNDAIDEGTETIEVTLGTPVNATLGDISVMTYSILDNDDPQISFASSGTTVAESVGTHPVTVQLDRSNGAVVTVNYTVTGSATGGGVDYTLAAGTVSFPVATTTQVLSIPVVNDAVDELTEAVVLTLVNPSANAALGSTTVYTLAIRDNDDPLVSVVASDASASEAGLDAGTFRFDRTGDASRALTVHYTVTGTATASVVPDLAPYVAASGDYLALSGTVTIPASASNATVNVIVQQDTVDEVPETVIVTVTGGAGYNTTSPTQATVTIADDDLEGVSVTATDATAGETLATGGSGTFKFTRQSVDTSAPLLVNYTVGGTATAGSDYGTLSGSVTILATKTSANVTVGVIDDLDIEGTETVTATLAAGSYVIGSPSTASVNVMDNDNAVVAVTATDSAAAEAGLGTGTFKVTRTASDVSGALVVSYGVTGTATTGADYAALSGTVTIPATATSATFTLTPVDDALLEGPETVIVTLTATSQYTVGGTPATVTIADNEVAPKVSVTALDAAASEVGGIEDTAALAVAPQTAPLATNPGVFKFTRTGSTASDLVVTYTVTGTAASGSDFVALSGTVTITAGNTTRTVRLDPYDDLLYENSETVIVTLVDGVAYDLGTRTATVTIASDDAKPSVYLGSNDGAEDLATQDEGSYEPFYSHLSHSSGLPVTVTYTVTRVNTTLGTATANNDLIMGRSSVAAGTVANDPIGPAGDPCVSTPLESAVKTNTFTVKVTFAPGQTTCKVRTFAILDGVNDNGEKYRVKLSAPTNAVLDTMDSGELVTIHNVVVI